MINLVRNNILDLVPYQESVSKKGEIILNATHNQYTSTGYDKYPEIDILYKEISKLYKVKENNIVITNGSLTAIDVLIRTFCEPKKDNIITLYPCYSMYKICANIQDVETRDVVLKKENRYQLDIKDIKKQVDKNTKMIFITNPSSPFGVAFKRKNMLDLLKLNMIVVVDEAYIEFSDEKSFINLIKEYKNLVVLRTLSKAYGMAGLRIGFAISDKDNIHFLRGVNLPYSISTPNIKLCLKGLKKNKLNVNPIKKERERFTKLLKEIKEIDVIDSSTDFIFIQTNYIEDIEEIMNDNKIKLRYFPFGIRISIGQKIINDKIIKLLKEFFKSKSKLKK